MLAKFLLLVVPIGYALRWGFPQDRSFDNEPLRCVVKLPLDSRSDYPPQMQVFLLDDLLESEIAEYKYVVRHRLRRSHRGTPYHRVAILFD